ncbi:MAG: ATP-binding protein [Salibacteraceae bacterium]
MNTFTATESPQKGFNTDKVNKALNIAGIAMWEYNCQTNDCCYNANWYTIMGYAPYELPQKIETFFGLVHPDDLPRLHEAVSSFDAKANDGILEIQYRMRTKSNDWIWLRNRSSLELDKEGKPLTWLGSVFDVSRLKESENQALSNIQHLNAVVNSLSDIIFEISSDYNLASCWIPDSHPDCKLIRSYKGQNLKDVYSDRIFQFFKKLIDKTITTNKAQSFNFNSYRTDQHFLARATPLTNEFNGKKQVTMVIQEVTETFRTQQKLKNNEANLNAIIQNTSDVFWAIDKEERLIVYNKAFDDLLFNISGKRPKKGRTLDDSFLLEETAKRWRHIHSRSLNGLDTEFSKSLYFQDGRKRLYEFHINPYRNKEGEIIGSVLTGRDIDDIYSAKKQAEKAARLKSKFVSTISHEIRTPLNAILGTCHQLAKSNQQENLVDDIEILQLASDNLLSLINDVLDFTKLDSGKGQIKEQKINFENFLRSLSQFQERLATNKGLTFTHSQIGEIPDFITTDKTKLHQILTNVISNAIKYTNSGGIDFKITSTLLNQSKASLVFEIKDTGIGIPHKELDSIFDSFTQSSTSYNMLKGGTGLGLAITKKLVNLLNGKINVKSELDQGSIFTLNFEFEVTKDNTKTPTLKPKIHSFPNVKVLIAEDNEINAKIITHLFDQWNIKYDLAPNGLEAVNYAKSNNYSLILMDLQMPIMNGFEASYQISKLLKIKQNQIPIIALTAQSDFSFDSNYKEGIFTSSILKPYHPESLKTTIFEQLTQTG